jgi:hypothetical protein
MLNLRTFLILLGVLSTAMGLHASIRPDHILPSRLAFHQADETAYLFTLSAHDAKGTPTLHTSSTQPLLPQTSKKASQITHCVWEIDDTIEDPLCVSATPQADNVNLLDAKAKKHILDGDETGGGHRFGTGKAGKTEFPAHWSDEKIKAEILNIALDPNTRWSKPDARGYISGEAERENVEIRVIYDTRKSRIVTAYPTNVPKNTQ